MFLLFGFAGIIVMLGYIFGGEDGAFATAIAVILLVFGFFMVILLGITYWVLGWGGVAWVVGSTLFLMIGYEVRQGIEAQRKP